MVLGSTQRISPRYANYAQQHHLELCTRGSGGTGVIAKAGEVIWIDIGLPSYDPLLGDDVSASFAPVAAAWISALGEAGLKGAATHRGAMRKSADFAEVCFAGLAPGEITVAGRKLVGMSQRRSGHGAYFHTLAYRHFPLEETMEAFAPSASLAPGDPEIKVTDLATVLREGALLDDVTLAEGIVEALNGLSG